MYTSTLLQQLGPAGRRQFALGLLSLATAGAAQAQTFGTATAYGTGGSNSYFVTTGDLNGDGRPDIVASNVNGAESGSPLGTLSVLLALPGGGFATAATYPTGGRVTYGVVLADVNSDGRLDAVTVNLNTDNVSVLLGTGTGTLGTATLYSLGSGTRPFSVAVGDVNLDGRPDIVTANSHFSTGTNGTASVLLNAGSGAFGAAVNYTAGVGSSPRGIVLADITQDGRPDAVLTDVTAGTVVVMPGLTGGQLGAPTTRAVGSFPFFVAAADINQDGRADVVASSASNNVISVLLGQAGGSLATTAVSYSTAGSTPDGLALSDVNGDGRSDVVVSNFSSNTVAVLAGTGTGTFGTAATYTTGAAPYGLAVADFSADGKPDIVTANSGTNTVSVLLNSTVYAAPTLTNVAPASGPVGTTVTLTGTNFSAATAVSFNGTAATNFTVGSPTSITVVVPAGATTGNVTVTTPGGTSNGLLFTVVATTTRWLGGRTTDWFSATNWSDGVPSSTLDVSIPAGTAPYPVIGAGSAAAKSLTIASSASLTLSGGTLDVKGTLGNNGTLTASAGTVSLSGTSAQVIGGSGSTQFWNLTVTNAAGAQQGGPVSIRRALALAAGSLTTNGQPLTLLSDASGTALVDNSGGVVNGAATVQRYITPNLNGNAGYRHYSSPVNGTTVADLATSGFTPTLNGGYNTATRPELVTPFPTVFGYDEARVLSSPAVSYSAFDKGWFSPAATSSPLENGLGYTVNIPASQTVDFVGQLNNGTVSRTLARTSPDGGLHLVGNPYPSPLDWSRVTVPAGLDNAIYVYQSTNVYDGAYRSYVNGVGDPVVALGQGFFVRVTPGTASTTLTLTNAARVADPAQQPVFNRGTETRPLLQLALRGAGNRTDEAYVYFENGATAGLDARFDALKLQHNTGGTPSLYALAAGTELSINGLPQLTATTIVPVGLELPQAGTYTLTAASLLNLTTAGVYLHDAVTGQDIDLQQQPAYSFSVSAPAVLANRFSIRFTPARVLATATALNAASVSVYPNPAAERFTVLVPGVPGAAQVRATLLNSLGQQVGQQTVALPAAGTQLRFDVASLAAGIYLLQVQAGTTVITKSISLQ